MWPQLWEQNEHIINPHWIYPDDKILIRPVTPLAEAKPPEPAPEPVTPPASSTGTGADAPALLAAGGRCGASDGKPLGDLLRFTATLAGDQIRGPVLFRVRA